jgi:integrase
MESPANTVVKPTGRRTLPARGVRQFINSIRPPVTGRDVYYDSVIRGLCLRVSPSGNKSWLWQYRNPAPKKFTIGKWPRINEETARRLAQLAQRDLDLSNVDPLDAKRKRREAAEKARTARRTHRHNGTGTAPTGTFRAVFEAYVADFTREVAKGERSQITLDELKRIINKEAASWMDRPMASITDDDVFVAMDAIRQRGAVVAANRFLAWAKAIWVWAVAHRRLVDANGQTVKVSPLVGLKKLEKEVERKRVLRHKEIVLFWRASETFEQPWKSFFHALLLTGQRLNEVAQAEWKEIDGRVWKVPAHRVGNKNGEAHIVHLSEAALKVLADLPKTGKYIFSVDGERPISGFNRAKVRLDNAMLAVAGLPPSKDGYKSPFETNPQELESFGSFTFHDLRRSCATGLGELKFPPHVVDIILNHRLRGVGARYNHAALEEECSRALELWGTQLLSWVDSQPSNVVRPAFR